MLVATVLGSMALEDNLKTSRGFQNTYILCPFWSSKVLWDGSERKISQNKKYLRSSRCGSAVMSLAAIHEDEGLIPGLTQWVKDPTLP